MLIAARESFAAAARKRLPYDAEVEYLESTGTQYIRLVTSQIALNTSFEWNIRLRFTSSPSSSYYITGLTTNAEQMFVAYNSSSNTKVYMSCDGKATLAPKLREGSETTWHDYAVVRNGTNTKYIVDTIVVRNFSATNFNVNRFDLFAAVNQGGVRQGLVGRQQIHSCSLVVGGVPRYDCISCRNNGVGYMYDRVSGTFFGNAGTGSFTIGPDITA